MAVASEPPRTRRFTADEVWRMVEVGLLGPDEPYELIDGELRYVSPQDPPHAGAVRFLTSALVTAYGEAYHVGVQLPIGGIADSIPEPDLAVTAARRLDDPHPTGPEVVLVIEVADSSLRNALDKVAIYARARCPEYWIVDIAGQRVIAHRRPRPDGAWETVEEARRGMELALPVIEEPIPVDAFLPKPGG